MHISIRKRSPKIMRLRRNLIQKKKRINIILMPCGSYRPPEKTMTARQRSTGSKGTGRRFSDVCGQKIDAGTAGNYISCHYLVSLSCSRCTLFCGRPLFCGLDRSFAGDQTQDAKSKSYFLIKIKQRCQICH